MKAIIIGAPIQLEGEPAEIAQLVDLLTSGKVAVEHVHRWRIDELDGSETVKGRCWCGVEKDFNPMAPEKGKSNTDLFVKEGPTPVRAPEKKARVCKVCGAEGHDVRKCPVAKAAA